MNKVTKAIGKHRARYVAGVVLTAVTGLAVLLSLPAPVQAADPIVLGDGVDTGGEAWSVDNIMPCDSGSETVVVQNDGADGVVYIWISDIVSGEGDNPESETDTDEPGELDGWLTLDVSAPGLQTSVALPAAVDNFPQSANYSNYVRIPLDSGQSVTIDWTWELPCATGNEAQGDTLSFDINYSLDIPPPPDDPPPRRPPERDPVPPYDDPTDEPRELTGVVAEVKLCPDDIIVQADPGQCFATNVDLGIPQCPEEGCVAAITNDAPDIFPVGETIVTWTTTDTKGHVITCTQIVTVIGGENYLEIDMLGEITRVQLACPNCVVAQTSLAPDPDDQHFLRLEQGTGVLCIESETTFSCPQLIVMSISEETLVVPDGYVQLGPVYDFTGYRDQERLYPICAHVHFDQPVTMQLNYPPADLPPGFEPPFIAYYDAESNAWVRLAYATTGQVAEGVSAVNGLTQQLSLFTVLAESPANPYQVPVDLPGISSVDWRLIVGIVGGALLALGLILFYRRRRRRKRLTTAT